MPNFFTLNLIFPFISAVNSIESWKRKKNDKRERGINDEPEGSWKVQRRKKGARRGSRRRSDGGAPGASWGRRISTSIWTLTVSSNSERYWTSSKTCLCYYYFLIRLDSKLTSLWTSNSSHSLHCTAHLNHPDQKRSSNKKGNKNGSCHEIFYLQCNSPKRVFVTVCVPVCVCVYVEMVLWAGMRYCQ